MRNINNLRYADDTTIMAESEEELSSLLIKVKVESEKTGLHLKNYDHGILSHNFVAKRWGNMETVTDSFFFFVFKVLWMVCSQEIKRHLLLGRKAITNLDSVLKSRDNILPTEVHIVKAMVFRVVMFMYGCKCWTIRKAVHQRIDAFELWCWRRLLRVCRTATRSN